MIEIHHEMIRYGDHFNETTVSMMTFTFYLDKK